MQSLLEKYLDKVQIEEAFSNADVDNPTNKKIGKIFADIGYRATSFFLTDISSDPRQKHYELHGSVTPVDRIHGISINIRRYVGDKQKYPKISLNAPAIGEETEEEFGKRVQQLNKIVKALEELKKIDWRTLYLMPYDEE